MKLIFKNKLVKDLVKGELFFDGMFWAEVKSVGYKTTKAGDTHFGIYPKGEQHFLIYPEDREMLVGCKVGKTQKKKKQKLVEEQHLRLPKPSLEDTIEHQLFIKEQTYV